MTCYDLTEKFEVTENSDSTALGLIGPAVEMPADLIMSACACEYRFKYRISSSCCLSRHAMVNIRNSS